ncbi:MAG: hypothetical protein GY928_26975 [Colwellia sp.]|nr:hypothetical protein [Colwellia sp.]
MSIEYNKGKGRGKTTADDEKFIDELYAELDKEINNLTDEQPSQALDESIIAAAYEAVTPNSKVTDIKTKQQSAKQFKSKKSSAWHVPFSLAASTVLVMVLFVNQGDDAIVPQSSITPEPMLIESEEGSEMIFESSPSESLAVESEALGMKSLRAPLQMKQAPKRAIVKSVTNSAYQAMEGKQELMAPELAMTQDIAKNSVNIKKKGRNKRVVSGSAVNLSQAPWLSYSKYLLFKEQKLPWSLMVENKDDYLILVVISADKSEEYRMSKDKYLITNLPGAQETHSSFEQIKAINN